MHEATTKKIYPSGMPLAASVVIGKSKRSDFPLEPSRCALLVIDVQEYLSQPRTPDEAQSYLFSTSIPRMVKNVEKLLKYFRQEREKATKGGCEVLLTYLEALTPDCRDISLDYKLSGPKLSSLPNNVTSPAKFLPEVSPSFDGRGDICIPKTSCSVFQSTNIQYLLRNLGVEQLVVTGQLTDQCVESAVRDAADLGFFVSVVEDACAAMSEDDHARGLQGMKGFCRTMTTNSVLEEITSLQPDLKKLKASS